MNIPEIESKITKFSIIKLFGEKDVTINFDNHIKIFVGENGIGKTTILNIFYLTLKLKFKELQRFNFHSIKIDFRSGSEILILNEWLPNEDDYYEYERVYKRISRYFSRDEFLSFEKFNIINDIDYLDYFLMVDKRINSGDKYPSVLKKEVENIIHNDFNLEKLMDARSVIKNEITEEILYFPTYRRIEEDLHKLGYALRDEKSFKEREILFSNHNNNDSSEIIKKDVELIQFGMKDVQESFNKITESIRSSSLVGYSEITGKMITKLVHDYETTSEMKEKVKFSESLNIVLDRVGDYLSEIDKKKIRDLIESSEIFEANMNSYDPLIYFLYNLIELYEQQSEKDNAIKNFMNSCNKFLVNKSVQYDESSVKINIKNEAFKNVELDTLSSGEKQIVSLFSKIYLESIGEFLILFDEPELSLSLEWQEKLLPEIVNSDKCKFMVVVTHSPFIYSNNLMDFAESMDESIKEVKNYE